MNKKDLLKIAIAKNMELPNTVEKKLLGSKKVDDRESRLIPWKIKEIIHSLKNANHINEISYILLEI